MSRVLTMIGNWKMHKNVEEAQLFVDQMLHQLPDLKHSHVHIALAPPFIALHPLYLSTRSSYIRLAAQNVHQTSHGAFTGEISASMLAATGVSYVIIGHSERRTLFKETSFIVSQKAQAVLSHHMTPVICIGETKQEREEGRYFQVIAQQLEESLHSLTPDQVARVILAYEPVWAIGTGLTATPQMAQEIHAFCQKWLEEHRRSSKRIPIIYGGSVKPDNVCSLMEQPDIEGALIGGASLESSSFIHIIKAIL